MWFSRWLRNINLDDGSVITLCVFGVVIAVNEVWKAVN